MTNKYKSIASGIIFACFLAGSADALQIDTFRLRSPDDSHDIEQASDLYYGKLGDRNGLWLVCDRNGGDSAGKIYFISDKQLKDTAPGHAIFADEEITIIPPNMSWARFSHNNFAAGIDVVEDLKKRLTPPGPDQQKEPSLDLEAITIAPSLMPPNDMHLFVVAEEPLSTVLELALEKDGSSTKARLVGVYSYRELPDQQGTAKNDGLEGLAYAGKPGEFYFVEEGTHSHTEEPKPLLMFRDPILGRAHFEQSQVKAIASDTEALTKAVRAQRKGAMQTLNAVTLLPNGQLLAIDRNGGWILRVDPESKTAERWMNLYDLDGVNLREKLANFPKERRMEYVSIEGIAAGDDHTLWLVDDPAMPENFHESCLVRIQGVKFPSSRPTQN